MSEFVIKAEIENLHKVLSYIDEELEKHNCPAATMMAIDVAVEEIFVNIASYAYGSDEGEASITIDASGDPVSATITFRDSGVPFDPLAKEDPDITLPAEKRQIGGLGIFMVKKSMDDVVYENKDGYNILTIKKKLV